jgi:glycerophosphoryl diester phosphodiesterase
MRWARPRGYAVHTWTVDDPDEMRRLIALGVNSIITNQPDVLQQVLKA